MPWLNTIEMSQVCNINSLYFNNNSRQYKFTSYLSTVFYLGKHKYWIKKYGSESTLVHIKNREQKYVC